MNPIAHWAARLPFYYGWTVAAAVSLTIMGAMTFAVSTFSVYVEPLSREFGWSRTAISGAISFATLGSALAGPLLGWLVDRYGSRLILGGGSFVMAFALFGLASMQTLAMFYVFYTAGRVVMMNAEHLIGPTAVANWFIRRRALATALVLASSRVGLGLWPALAGLLFVIGDWRLALWVSGVAVLVTSIVPLLFIVARRPEEAGMLPDGDTQTPARQAVTAGGEPDWTAREALRTQAFWLITIASTITLFVGGGTGLHRIPYFVDKGLSAPLLGPVLIAFAAGMAVGGFVAARLNARFSERGAMTFLMLCGGGLMALLLLTPGNWLAAGYSLLDGIVWGGVLTLQPVMYANFYGRRSVGTIRGLAHPVMMVGNAGGALFGGVMFDAFAGDYTWVWVTFGLLMLLGATAARLARRPRRRVAVATGG